MQLRNSPDRYGAAPLTLHWLMVALVLTAWILGTFGDDLPRGAGRATGLFVHIAAGLLILALLVVRLGWRLADPPPAFERSPLGRWAEWTATLAHYTLYALLAAVPLVGVVVQFARGEALPIFGLFDIASLWAKDRALAKSVTEIHEILANVLVILAALHAAAALLHHWVFRDRTLIRMLPRLHGRGPIAG